MALVAVSTEPALNGRPLVGDAKGSRPKNDHRLEAFVGLGVETVKSCASAASSRAGMEFRRRGDAPRPVATMEGVRSRIAPAVLGRGSSRSRVGLREIVGGLSLPLKEVADTIEVMLPETPWPGLAVIVLDVSVETRDKGLGMNSSVSENPTLALLAGLNCTASLGLAISEELGSGSAVFG